MYICHINHIYNLLTSHPMKKTKFIRALLLVFIAFAFYSCSDVLPQSESIADMGTRALASDAEDGFYYYYKGEKIPLPVSATKRYVVTKTSDATPYSTQSAGSRIIDLVSHPGISTYSQNTDEKQVYGRPARFCHNKRHRQNRYFQSQALKACRMNFGIK